MHIITKILTALGIIAVPTIALTVSTAHAEGSGQLFQLQAAWDLGSGARYYDMLIQGTQIVSNKGKYRLAMQPDGNLVEYNQYGVAMWSSQTAWTGGGYAVQQVDGNFVVYNWNDQAVWANNQARHGVAPAIANRLG
jgi:hypothetical protein